MDIPAIDATCCERQASPAPLLASASRRRCRRDGQQPADRATAKAAFEYRSAGELVRSGWASGRVLGQAVQRRRELSDGELPPPTARAIDAMASQKWDFVAIQAFAIETLTEPVEKMIKAGTPVIAMDTLIAPLDKIAVHSFLAPDNEFMGAAVTQVLMDAIAGQGIVTMTQGALGHSGAQGRARGFSKIVKKYPNVEVVDTTPGD
jgi:ABC-type sugar transport system substrate-binding protein